jgi:uncharacterized protein
MGLFLIKRRTGAAVSIATFRYPPARPARTVYVAAAAPERARFAAGDSFVVGNVYRPLFHRAGQRHPAVVVGGSLASVKEMMSGTYAAELARRGILAMAIDYRNFGDSGGALRQYDDAETKSADLMAAAAHLASRPDVRGGGVGLLGICASAGNVLHAAARDRRIGAVATVAGLFAEPSAIAAEPICGGGGAEASARRRAEGRAARERFERTGENRLALCYHDTDLNAAFVCPGMDYYLNPARGAVPGWTNAIAVMSWQPALELDPVSVAAAVTAPACVVHSDGCAMPAQARKVHDHLGGRRSLHWMSGGHFDFYDDPQTIAAAADVVAQHFHAHLA